MNYTNALSVIEKYRYVIGKPVNGRKIHSLFICPVNKYEFGKFTRAVLQLMDFDTPLTTYMHKDLMVRAYFKQDEVNTLSSEPISDILSFLNINYQEADQAA